MATLTIEIPDDLMEQVAPIRDQIPELLRRCLQPATLSAQVYRYILDFLASQPTPDQIADFRPTTEMQQRLTYLLDRNAAETITSEECQELDEYEQIEHLIILLKSGNLPYLSAMAES
ncbi:hypothetical protein C1752_14867 [Acaryochloris thomasi RCC1774]|uniref:Uncharacterized protein n=1 Tax=Acaryochloris thomasi RCC1774 TaxID=1764569 RepID=A0A2W1JJ12_9CYAN|nr:hypothetical protein [Acaryochloris thomasi]PZD70254.1 hypothetical protein C1752_14867 [Acaryochloris thomasi RCC1774]